MGCGGKLDKERGEKGNRKEKVGRQDGDRKRERRIFQSTDRQRERDRLIGREERGILT